MIKSIFGQRFCLLSVYGLCLLLWEIKAYSKNEMHTYSLGLHAFTANAGGQQAYALRRANNDGEWSLIMNNYLVAGRFSLVGALYQWRFAICNQSCVVQAYLQAGFGLTTGGPTVELSWVSIFLWVGRIDFATQVFVNPRYLSTWSYPLWIGFSLPLPF